MKLFQHVFPDNHHASRSEIMLHGSDLDRFPSLIACPLVTIPFGAAEFVPRNIDSTKAVEPMDSDGLQRTFNKIGKCFGIVVDIRYPIGTGVAEREVASMTQARLVFNDHVKGAVLSGKSLSDLLCLIGGSIVHNDYFKSVCSGSLVYQ